MLEELARFETRYPLIPILLAIILTILAVSGLSKLRLETNFETLVPQNIPEIAAIRAVRDRFGGADVISIIVELDGGSFRDIRDPEIMRTIDSLERSLEKRGDLGIQDVIGPGKIIRSILGYLPSDYDDLRRLTEESEVLSKYFNDRYTMTRIDIRADVKADIRAEREFMEGIRREIELSDFPEGVRVYVTGDRPLAYEGRSLLNRDMSRLTLVGLFLNLLVMLAFYRALAKSLLPLAVVLTATIWAFGFHPLLGIPITPASAGMGSMIIGMGIDFGIHIVHRYDEERRRGLLVEDAIARSLSSVGKAVFITALATILGFLSLMAANLPFIRWMGISLAMGMFFSLIAAFTLLPPLIAIIEGRKKRSEVRNE